MKRLWGRLQGNLLLKLASYNSILILVRLLTGVAMSNIIANYVGPAGMTLMGNLRNFMQGAQQLSTLGIDNGLIKTTSSARSDRFKLMGLTKAALFISLTASVILSICIAILAPIINDYLFAVADYTSLIRMLSLAFPAYTVFFIVSSLLQSQELFKPFITLNICIAIVSFLLSACLAIEFSVQGALYGIALVPFVQLLFTLLFLPSIVGRLQLTLKEIFNHRLERSAIHLLLSFSFLALFSAVVVPAVNIVVREDLRDVMGDVQAGYWEAMVRLSGYYMMFASSLIALYVLPAISSDDSSAHFRSTIAKFYKTVLPLVALGCGVIFIVKEYLVVFLYNEDFLPMLELFKWQLPADFIRIITMVLAFRLIAQNDIKRYLIAEVLSVASFYIFSRLAIPLYGLEGVTIAYLFNYIFYAIVLLVLLRRDLFGKNPV